MNETILILGLVVSSVVFGYRTYVAWILPDKHREHLDYWSGFLRGLVRKAGEEWWQTDIQFWIMRIGYTIGFLISLVGAVSLLLDL